MTTVKAKYDVIQVLTENQIDGETVITVDCADFDTFKNLPPAVEHTSGVLVKTGWNSDTNYACYKSEKPGQLVKCKQCRLAGNHKMDCSNR